MLDVFKGKDIRITLHAAQRFMSRYSGVIPSNVNDFLTARVYKLLNKEVQSVELIRITDLKNYNLIHPRSISLYDIELSLIFVISYDDFSLVTIRKDLHNFKKPKNSVINTNIINNWIPIIDKDNVNYMYTTLKNLKAYPETIILYKIGKDYLHKTNMKYITKYIQNIISVEDLCEVVVDDEVIYTIHIDTSDKLYINNSYFFYHEIQDDGKLKVVRCRVSENDVEIIKERVYKVDTSKEFILYRNLKTILYRKWYKFFKENFKYGDDKDGK